MSSHTPSKISTPVRTFGAPEPAQDDADTAQVPTSQGSGIGMARTFTGSLSFESDGRRSFLSKWRRRVSESDGTETPAKETAPIPTLQPTVESFSTPLPVLSMIVLSVAMLGEFLTANVATPFLLFMVGGFGELSDSAEIAFWTGNIVASFFLTQFLTSLLWATVAERYGQRFVLFSFLLGSSITCLLFGTFTSLAEAISVRLLQGVFGGAIGVARGTVTIITDPTNEGRAYAILGFCWGFGGVAGAIIGGTFESPANKWPNVFGKIPFFVNYPYILPAAIAASVTLIGAILSLFLGRDAGPRGRGIQLPLKDDEDLHPPIPEEEEALEAPGSPTPARGFIGSIRKKASQRLSGYFGSDSPAGPVALSSTKPSSPLVISSVPNRRMSNRFNGSAYGYGSSTASFRSRLASNATVASRHRRSSLTGSLRRRTLNMASGSADPEAGLSQSFAEREGSDLNFAQRLLLANENAVSNIADLWVAAAMNIDADNEEVFESDTDLEMDMENEYESANDDSQAIEDEEEEGDGASSSTRRPRSRRLNRGSFGGLGIGQPSYGSPYQQRLRSGSRGVDDSTTIRRASIFAHSGVRTPPAVLNELAQPISTPLAESSNTDLLNPIEEHSRETSGQLSPLLEPISEKPPSLLKQLPILIIIQYGLLALHSTTHDQIFLSYLVSRYPAGGLNLQPGHFSQLIALMSLAQIAYQFYLYPNLGPPRGRFSHLTMFRIGSLLFIPSYLTVIPWRMFANATEDGSFILMAALTFSTALRYAGITFAYTAVAILLNYMTPPSAVGFANGVAQSIVSLARCFGPVLGGWLWSVSVEGHPEGYSLGFLVCAGVTAVAVATSFFIR